MGMHSAGSTTCVGRVCVGGGAAYMGICLAGSVTWGERGHAWACTQLGPPACVFVCVCGGGHALGP